MLFNNKTTKLFILILFTVCFKPSAVKSQEISTYLLGNNAWYDGYGLTPLWDDMALAKFQTIRIGGAAAEGYAPNNSKFITLIDGIRTAKAEPIVQIPRTWTDQQVKDFITNINITRGKNIKFWSIGNEPDHSNRPSPIEQVSAYIKRISSALKSVDPTIKVFGPETAGFNSSTYITRFLGGDLDITGKDANGNYYIDVYTWHRYMFSDILGLENDVNTFLSRVSIPNSKRPEGQKISWGLTEFNSSYDNDKNTSPDMDVWSFHAGQTFAEVYGLGMRKGAFSMNAWSMLEGEVERKGTDLSLFDKDFKGRANYYHCLMLGQNMKKNYITTTDNKGFVVVIPMQDETGVAVMILNKDHNNSFEYTLRLNYGTYIESKALQIKVNAGIDKEIYGSIGKEATQMLVFDNAGTLIKRYTYSSSDSDLRGEPLVENISADPVPSTSLTLPASNNTISLKTAVNLEATASDNGTVAKVEFTANGTKIGTSTVPPYKFTWTPTTSGTYNISARAYDDLGGVGFASESIELIVEKVINYVPIPAQIEAEAYDDMLGIVLGATTDAGGGQNAGYCDVGDWMDYPVNVPTAGQYEIEARVASLNATGAFDLKIGSNVLASYTLNPGTGGWQTWTTLTKTVSLNPGPQLIRLLITGKEININWLKFNSITSSLETSVLPKLRIYPNPVSNGEFHVVLDAKSHNETVKVELFTLSGQRIYSQNQIVPNSGIIDVKLKKNVISNSDLYLVSIQTKSGIYKEKLLFRK